MDQNNESDRRITKLSEIIDQWSELEMNWYSVIERWVRMGVLTRWDLLEFHRGGLQVEDILKIFDQNFIDVVSFKRMLIKHRDLLKGEEPTQFPDILLSFPDAEPIMEEHRRAVLVRRGDVFKTAADKIRTLNQIKQEINLAREVKDKTTLAIVIGVYEIDWIGLGLPWGTSEALGNMIDILSPTTRLFDRLNEGVEARMEEIRGGGGRRHSRYLTAK